MIVTLKMITSEEVVGRVNDEGENFIELEKPRTFQVIQDENGNVRAGLVPWFMSDPDVVVMISKSHVVAQSESASALTEAYIKQTSSLDLSAANGKIIA
jgi:hypothetical protein